MFNLGVLIPFMKYVESLAYEDKPDYGYLRHLLVKILLEKELVPDSEYDWDVAVKVSYNCLYISLNVKISELL